MQNLESAEMEFVHSDKDQIAWKISKLHPTPAVCTMAGDTMDQEKLIYKHAKGQAFLQSRVALPCRVLFASCVNLHT